MKLTKLMAAILLLSASYGHAFAFTAPTVTATAVSTSAIDLTWTAATPDTGDTISQYQVTRNGTVVATLSGSTLAFNDTGLAPSTTYNYTVIASETGTATSTTANATTQTPPSAPVVASINPTSGVPAGGTSVAVNGTGFTGATSVKFGTTNATSYTVNSSTSITAVSPAGSGGSGTLTFDAQGHTDNAGANVTSYTSAPLTVGTGSNRALVCFAAIGGNSVAVGSPAATWDSGGSNQAMTKLATAHNTSGLDEDVIAFGLVNPASGAKNLKVTWTGSSAITVACYSFTGANQSGGTSTFPNVGTSTHTAGSGTTTDSVTVTGATGDIAVALQSTDGQISDSSESPTADFVDNNTSATAGWHNSASTSNTYTATLNNIYGAASSAAVDVRGATSASTVDVTVTTSAGTSATSSTDKFTYTSVAAPNVTSISPTSGTTAGGTSVAIAGTGFTGATGVSFGSTAAASFTVNSDTSVTATTPVEAAGNVNVTVTTPNGTSGIVTGDVFAFVAPAAPTVTQVVPTTGSTSGGTSVAITGTALTGATAVKFGTTAATSFTVNSATSITATSPAESAGTVDITVTTPNGTSATSSADQFAFSAAPAVTAISPTSGTTAGGSSVTVTGTGFTGASGVNFGSTAATSFTVNSATSITAVSPAESAATVDITVTTPNGTSSTGSADQFTFQAAAAPTITSVAPSSGTTAGGTAVTITGTAFTGATAGSFGSTAATSFTVNSATQISAVAPAETAATVDITVTTPNGTSTTGSSDQFTFQAPATGLNNVGINPPSITYYQNLAMYADATLAVQGNSGVWDTPSMGGSAATLDSTGTPTGSAGTAFSGAYPSGTYTASWSGSSASLSCSVGVGNGSCTMGSPTTTGGVTSQTMTLIQSTDMADEPWFGLQITGTMTNLHIMASPALTAPGTMFLQDFITRMGPFSTVRWMGALNTNFLATDLVSPNPVENWSQRTTVGGRGDQNGGMAYEDIIAFANSTGKDVWINIPILATDDYVCRVARLFAYGEQNNGNNGSCSPTAAPGTATTAPLNSNVHLYVEEANEVWNGVYSAYNTLNCWGGTPGACPGGVPTTPTSSTLHTAVTSSAWTGWSGSEFDKGYAAGVVLTKRNHDIFNQVFGSTSRNTASQIRVMYNTQSGATGQYGTAGNGTNGALPFMATTYGPLSNYIWGLAYAPYFQLCNSADSSSVSSIFSDLNSSVLVQAGSCSSGQEILGDVQYAQSFGLNFAAYEAGQSLTDGSSAENTAQTATQMYTAYKTYQQLWNTNAGQGALINYLSFTEPFWGVLVGQADHGDQKFDAIVSGAVKPGDANLDGVVDAKDCAILTANWGKTTGQWWMDGDFNHDGGVGADDLSILNANITGTACPTP